MVNLPPLPVISSASSNTMDFEDILNQVGDFGSYQKKLIYVFMIPTTFASAMYVMNVIFMVAVPDHWCKVPELMASNLTLEEQKLLSVPRILSDGEEVFSKCLMYDLDYSKLLQNLSRTENGTFDVPLSSGLILSSTIKCTSGWHYDRSLYTETAATKWDLVCDHDQLPSLVLTLGNVGSVIGTLIFGYLADRFGRRCAFFLNISLSVVTGTLSVLSPNFAVFAVLRMLVGAALPSNFQMPYIIVVEQVGPKVRSRLVCLSWVLWTCGGCFLALLAYLSGHWVTLGLVTTLPAVLAALYWRYLPSSPRLLLSKGRYQETADVLCRIARENGKEAPNDLLPKLLKICQSMKATDQEEKKYSVKDLWRFPQLRKKLFIVTINWCAIAVSYFGLIINVSNLGGDDFMNYFFLSAVELPSFFVACYVMDRWGRRWANASFVLTAGLACLFPVFLPAGLWWVTIAASLFGKFGSAAAFMVIYQQAAELFPTPVRSLGMSIGSTLSSLAIIFMPYVVYLGVYNKAIPFLILGGICLVAGLISPMVPETLNEKLPQSIPESELFGVHQKFFSCARRQSDDYDDPESSVCFKRKREGGAETHKEMEPAVELLSSV